MVFFALFTLGVTAVGATVVHAQEVVPVSEAGDIQQISTLIEAGVRAQFTNNGVAVRDAHTKHHGCLYATVKVVRDLPAAYAVGVFAKPTTYQATIRLSNGAGSIQDDRKGDARGFALKLLDVPGDKILEDERDAQTQDFLMINHNAFFVRDVADYVKFSKGAAAGTPLRFFFGLNPFNWHLKEAKIVNDIRMKHVINPIEIRYTSVVPILMGHIPAKYAVTPCRGQTYASVASSPNQLREALAMQLDPTREGPGVCFELGIQLQTDVHEMPIEDPTVVWDEKQSPFKTVAIIEIPRQQFQSSETVAECENMSYTPWHSLPEHRPIGGIQRARKTVYQTISRVRHLLNQQPRIEPY